MTGREEVFYCRRSARPEWWPEDVPWAASRSAWHTEVCFISEIHHSLCNKNIFVKIKKREVYVL